MIDGKNNVYFCKYILFYFFCFYRDFLETVKRVMLPLLKNPLLIMRITKMNNFKCTKFFYSKILKNTNFSLFQNRETFKEILNS